jgi:TRAP-type C4-dicarboxylate transport system permease small subunit
MAIERTKLLARLHRFEDWLLTFLVIALVVLAGMQILLRNVFDTGLSWVDPLTRAMVLWTAMLGALVATREDQHIGLDFIGRFVSGNALHVARFVALGFAAALCAAMAWFSVDLIRLDLDGGTAGAAGMPAWVLELILPVGFGLMALRFAIRAWLGPTHPPQQIPTDFPQ